MQIEMDLICRANLKYCCLNDIIESISIDISKQNMCEIIIVHGVRCRCSTQNGCGVSVNKSAYRNCVFATFDK